MDEYKRSCANSTCAKTSVLISAMLSVRVHCSSRCKWSHPSLRALEAASNHETTSCRPLPHADTNVLLTGMDLFEDANHFHDVVVLQTVLEELKARSLPLYNRLMALTKSEDKRFYLFFNEFRSETSVRREEGESINDRNDRAVRQAAKWYSDHLAAVVRKTAPAVVILTNDQENKRKSKDQKLLAVSLRDYVSELDDGDRLLDMVAESQGSKQTAGELFYPEYYTSTRLATGLKAGTLHQGIFNVSTYNYLEEV